MSGPRRHLPLTPLLRAYDQAAPAPGDLAGLPALGPRVRAIAAARADLVADSFLETASEAVFLTALAKFYESVAQPPLHPASLTRRAGLVRFALNHLVRCSDPLTTKAERVLSAD